MRFDSLQSGIGFTNRLAEDDEFNVLDYLYYYNGAGVSAGDVNNDGWTDLFFVSNRGQNKLYLNRTGDGKDRLRFEDVSGYAGIEGFSDWKTGSVMADVNGDGWLDIYVCTVGNFKGLEGANELYINNGKDSTGRVSFSEQGAAYGLDVSAFSSQATFFDYDKDGDLDMYLVTHAKNTSRQYDMVSTRDLRPDEANDFLFENQLISSNSSAKEPHNHFVDVSEKSGIRNAPMGYGVGVVIADFNGDHWDDIYVTNDFHEADYYFVNNHDGTFTESLAKHFTHVSEYSRGCDAADMNNDGLTDVMTLDICPEDETTEKLSMGEDALELLVYKKAYGYFPQYSRNALQLNMGGGMFSDIAVMGGVAATDWSWSTLLADYDNDGVKDIFISNGILKRTNNLKYLEFVSTDTLRYANETSRYLDRTAIAMMPGGKRHNHLYRGSTTSMYEDVSDAWGFQTDGVSSGAAYADLDNDGDLDLVTNSINEPASIYTNRSDELFRNHYLKIKLNAGDGNSFGIGATVYLKHAGKTQMQQVTNARGFLSSVEPTLSFGMGDQASIDTVIIIWPDMDRQILTNVKTDQVVVVRKANKDRIDNSFLHSQFAQGPKWFNEDTRTFNVDYRHKENGYNDFYREPLMPFQISAEGPKVAVGDVNGDGLDDFYVGGAKLQAGRLFIQTTSGGFISRDMPLFQQDSVFEDVDAVFFDADNDGDPDLYVVSGGNEFFDRMPQLSDRLYLNDGSGNFFKRSPLPAMFDNKSCVEPCDFDRDGDVDLFVGGRVVGYQYGKSPNSYLLVNDGLTDSGTVRFTDRTSALAPALKNAGMITDAVWSDYDNDGDMDLAVVGDWMPVRQFENDGASLHARDIGLDSVKGFWQTVASGDFDHDGDIDLVAGNIGLNSRLRKGEQPHVSLIQVKADTNSVHHTVLTYAKGNRSYPLVSRKGMIKQFPFLADRYKDDDDFAGRSIEELFTSTELARTQSLDVNCWESVLFENLGNKTFGRHALPIELQTSKVFAIYVGDFNSDGNLDIFAGGNSAAVSGYQGAYDASFGTVLQGDGRNHFFSLPPARSGVMLQGEVRDIKSINVAGESVILVAANNRPLQLYRLQKYAGTR